MELIQNPQQMQQLSLELHKSGKTIGFVPTMGALHDGHLSLIRHAHKDCSTVVVSIFVNPTQFGAGEDYLTYPHNLEQDMKLSKAACADIIFAPSAEQMYPKGYQTFIDLGEVTQGLCGASRPGHFCGVATVVCKLFNIVMPDCAYFGQKDYQQTLVIKRMTSELNLSAKIIVLPTLREKDGLAMSSRNTYLNAQERVAATILYHTLTLGKELISRGETNAANLRQAMLQTLSQEKLAQLDYLAISDSETLMPLDKITPGKAVIALAVKIGKTRLIDNMLA